jgi:hypothetical protein
MLRRRSSKLQMIPSMSLPPTSESRPTTMGRGLMLSKNGDQDMSSSVTRSGFWPLLMDQPASSLYLKFSTGKMDKPKNLEKGSPYRQILVRICLFSLNASKPPLIRTICFKP